MKRKHLFGMMLMTLVIGMGFTSCEKDDDFGIEVNLRNSNNGGGSVVVLTNDFLGVGDYNYVELNIDNTDNFWLDEYRSRGAGIVSVGRVSGLSKVTDIPTSGWTSKVSIKEGHGYIIRGSKNGKDYRYARVYVVDQFTGTSGGIIGATIRYEPDWK